MDGPFDHNEFEHFLKQNADAHRLYPSDRVWTRLYARMHGRRRRAIALLVLLPLLTATGWFIVENTGHRTTVISRSTLPALPEKRSIPASGEHTTTKLITELTNNLATDAAPSYEAPADLQSSSAVAIPDTDQSTTIAQATTPAPITAVAEATTAAPSTRAATATTAVEATSLETNAMPNAELQQTELQEVEIQEVDLQHSALEPTALQPADAEERYPLDIESVVNSYQRQLHRPRFRWQLHFTPTVSYRSLKEDQKFIAQARMSTSSAAAAMANSTDLASVIRHRPDIGMQLGFTGTYPLSKKIDWVTGLQFNVSKYDIAAYNYPSEVATIALMNPWGGTSTVSTITSFRSSGFRSTANWLRNYYYSVSLPLGLQWRVLGKKQTYWGISATVQPTYVVGNRSYVISVDYQNYAEVPYLINKWNLNVGIETYARFQLGKTDFQIGPQLRYQALSSFKKGYPVQEYLYDFGVKLGVRLGK